MVTNLRCQFYTSSTCRKSTIPILSSLFCSFIGLISGLITPCSPITQLSGLFSCLTASPSNIRPCINASGRGGQPGTYTSTGKILSTPCTTLYISYIPPLLAQLPIEITQRGSIICSWRRFMIGTILIKTVPAMTMTSASLGVPLMTSAPNLATSNLLVMLVAISTKQQLRPKWKGHNEFFLPHPNKLCTEVSIMLLLTASSMLPVPVNLPDVSFALLNHQFI